VARTSPDGGDTAGEHGQAGWPALTRERRVWPASGQSFRFEDLIDRPYDAAVPASISRAEPRLPGAVQAAADRATAEVARFDLESRDAPVPMPAILLRSESASSSQIEHLTASAKNLALSMIGLGGRQNADLVAANARAMSQALQQTEVTEAGILATHRTLLGAVDPNAGQWRAEPVWIGRAGSIPPTAEYVPPFHTRVPAAMADLVEFAARDDLPVLVHAALAHAQFETIHPFTDGNGRTGRVLIHNVLRRRGLVRHATVPVSSGLLAHPEGYFAALAAYREGDVAPIVSQVAGAAVLAVDNGRALAADIAQVRESWADMIPSRAGAASRRLADHMFAQPLVNTAAVVVSLGVSEPTARRALDELAAAGVIRQVTAARRNRVWQADAALQVMDRFAERSLRRQPPPR
jgi:Fic family protein